MVDQRYRLAVGEHPARFKPVNNSPCPIAADPNRCPSPTATSQNDRRPPATGHDPSGTTGHDPSGTTDHPGSPQYVRRASKPMGIQLLRPGQLHLQPSARRV